MNRYLVYLFYNLIDRPFAARLQTVLHEVLDFLVLGDNTVFNRF